MPDLEFLADMNIFPLTVKHLKKEKWNIARVSGIMDKRSKDIEILKFAEQNDKVLITYDLDFSMLLALEGYTKPSVINRRMENAKPDFVARRLTDLIPEIKKEIEEGIVVSVNETSIRYRNLPIG